MSTNQLGGLKKRSPTEAQRVTKYQTQQQQLPPPPHSSTTEESAKLSSETFEKHSKSDKNLKEESQSLSGSSTSQNEDQERDSDSGSSQNSSDIENALASIEPMQPINLERPSMHNLMYRKSSQPNGPAVGQQQMPSQQSMYSAEDYSDNSER